MPTFSQILSFPQAAENHTLTQNPHCALSQAARQSDKQISFWNRALSFTGGLK